MITEIEILRIEYQFTKRMIYQGVKYKSKEFYKRQAEFFSGAMIALNEAPPRRVIPCISGREIVPEYKL